jgi:hypothetical protein
MQRPGSVMQADAIRERKRNAVLVSGTAFMFQIA